MACPTCSTAAPVTIRTVDDINASDKQISSGADLATTYLSG